MWQAASLEGFVSALWGVWTCVVCFLLLLLLADTNSSKWYVLICNQAQVITRHKLKLCSFCSILVNSMRNWWVDKLWRWTRDLKSWGHRDLTTWKIDIYIYIFIFFPSEIDWVCSHVFHHPWCWYNKPGKSMTLTCNSAFYRALST